MCSMDGVEFVLYCFASFMTGAGVAFLIAKMIVEDQDA